MEKQNLIIFIAACFILYLLVNLFKFLRRVWWTPASVKRFMELQGIAGPPYRFLYGNSGEVQQMMMESLRKPMEFSHDIFPRVLPHIHAWIKLYGKNFIQWDGPKPRLVITDRDLIREIMSNKSGEYSKPELESYTRKLIGETIVAITTEGKKWKRKRKLADHAFHGECLKAMIPTMVGSVEEMLERWREREGQEIEVSKEISIMTSDVIAKTAFGSSFVEGKHVFGMLTTLSGLAIANSGKIRIIPSRFLRTKEDIKSDMLEQEINKAMLNMMMSRAEKVKKGEIESYGRDLLGLLVEAHQAGDESTRISTEDAVDECKGFFLGGHETTTSLLTWTILLLAKYMDWQDKARKEVMELFGMKPPTMDGVARLKTMNMIVNETLRLYPPVLTFPRAVEKEVILGNLTLPPKLSIEIGAIAVHHDPEIWGEDALLFKPERFSEGVSKAAKEGTSFLPFGLGPRFCIGQSFATVETKLALAMILQRFEFTLSPTYVHAPMRAQFTFPQHGVQIKLHKL